MARSKKTVAEEAASGMKKVWTPRVPWRKYKWCIEAGDYSQEALS